MQRPVHLVALAEFPANEREALLAVLRAAGVAPQQACASRLEPLAEGLPIVTVVSLPGWSRSYEGPDWVGALAVDLQSFRTAAPAAVSAR